MRRGKEREALRGELIQKWLCRTRRIIDQAQLENLNLASPISHSLRFTDMVSPHDPLVQRKGYVQIYPRVSGHHLEAEVLMEAQSLTHLWKDSR